MLFYLRHFCQSRSSSGSTPSVRPSVSNTLGVPGLCNHKLQKCSFLFIQTLPNVCSHIEDVHLLFCAHSINSFSFLRGVELGHFFHPQCLGGA